MLTSQLLHFIYQSVYFVYILVPVFAPKSSHTSQPPIQPPQFIENQQTKGFFQTPLRQPFSHNIINISI